MGSALRVAVVQLAARPVHQQDELAQCEEPYVLSHLRLPGPEFRACVRGLDLPQRTIARLRKEAYRGYCDNLNEKLRQTLRFLFLSDVSVALLPDNAIPPESLGVISDFTTRMTIVGGGALHGTSYSELLSTFNAETCGAQPRNALRFVFSPYANYFFDPTWHDHHIDVATTLDGPTVALSVIASRSDPTDNVSHNIAVQLLSSNAEDANDDVAVAILASLFVNDSASGGTTINPAGDIALRNALNPLPSASEGVIVLDLPDRRPSPQRTRASVWARAPILYAGRDAGAVELIEALQAFAQQGQASASQLADFRERYGSQLRNTSSPLRDILRFANRLRPGVSIPARFGRVPILPDPVLAPEEVEYQGIGSVLPLVRRVSDDPRSSDSTASSARHYAQELYSVQTRLATSVRTEYRSVAHRLPGGTKDDRSQRTDHWIFYATLTGYDPSEVARGLERQLTMLRTLARLKKFPIRITYRLLTVRGESRDLEAVFEVLCFLHDSDEAIAQDLRETFGELVHAAFVGIYGLSFSFERPTDEETGGFGRLEAPRHRVEIFRGRQEDGSLPSLLGRPDWGYVVDYLRSLPMPVVIEMECRPTALPVVTDGEGSPLDVGVSSGYRPSSGQPATAAESLLDGILSATRREPRSLELRVTIGSDETIPDSLIELLSVELGGGEAVAHRLLSNGRSRKGDVPAEARLFSPGEVLRVFHPPFGEFFQATARGYRPNELATSRESFPVTGTPLGYAKRRHAKADRWIPVRIPAEDRVRHMYVLGRTGSGKTNLLKGIATADLETPGRGLAVIDPHGDLAQHVMNSIPRLRLKDVTLIDLSDPDLLPTINPLLLDKQDPLVRSRVIQEVMGLLKSRIFHQYSGPRFDQMVRLAIDTLLDDGYGHHPSLVEVPLLFTDDDFQEAVRSTIVDDDLKQRWRFHDGLKSSREYADTVDWMTSKFDDIARDDTLRCILGGSANSVDFDAVLRDNGILIVHVPETVVGRQAADLIGSLVLLRLRLGLYRRARLPEGGFASRHEFFVIVDEFQKFATASFDELVAEARKFGVGFVLAHQNLEQLREFSLHTGASEEQLLRSILGNVGSYIIFGVGAPEADILSRQLAVPDAAVMAVPRYHALARLTVGGVETNSFTLRTAYTPPRTNPRMIDDLRSELLDMGRIRRREEVLAELQERLRSVKAGPEQAQAQNAPETTEQGGSGFLDEWLAKRRATKKTAPKGPTAFLSEHEDEEGQIGSGIAPILGERQVRDAPSRRTWNDILGPFYSIASAAKELGTSEDQVLELSAKHQILLLRTRRGTPVVPKSLIRDGQILPNLASILLLFLESGVDDWTLAAWLARPRPGLMEQSVIDWLADGGDVEMVRPMAEDAAGRFAL